MRYLQIASAVGTSFALRVEGTWPFAMWKK